MEVPQKGQSIFLFWVNADDQLQNSWLSGRVLSNRQAKTGLFKVSLKLPGDGSIITRLIDFCSPHMRPFWKIAPPGGVVAPESDEGIVNWLCCDIASCQKWHQLPVGLGPASFTSEKFTCAGAIWDVKRNAECDSVSKKNASERASKNSAPVVLSAYEKERELNVLQNRAFLKALMPEGGSSLMASSITQNLHTSVAEKKRKRDRDNTTALVPVRWSSRGMVEKNAKWEPADFTVKKKRNPRRDCHVTFVGALGPRGSATFQKGSKMTIEWEMDDPRSARGAYLYVGQKHRRVDDIYVVCPSVDAGVANRMSFDFVMPLHLAPGKEYFIEMGNNRPRIFGQSRLFTIEDPVGMFLESDVGVWCCGCNLTRHYVGRKGYKGSWIQCETCQGWQHEDCCMPSMVKKVSFACKYCRVEASSFSALPPLQNETPSRPPKKKDGAQTETRPGGHLSVETPSQKRTRFNDQKKMLTGILAMISKTAKYRRISSKLCSTPKHVSVFIRQIVESYGLVESKHRLIDLGAGHGSLTNELPAGTVAVEKLENRYEKGKSRVPHATWMNADAFGDSFLKYVIDNKRSFDFVISNPDFEVAFQTLFIAMYLLKEGSKMIFLLPSDFFEASPARMRVYKILNCRIEKEYKLGHLAFYEDNRSAEKLSTDSIFIITHGRSPKYEYTVMNSRLAGMLKT
jgi:hypothetical protein